MNIIMTITVAFLVAGGLLLAADGVRLVGGVGQVARSPRHGILTEYCQACGGSGLEHCCEGLREQPRETLGREAARSRAASTHVDRAASEHSYIDGK
jgi:hypothetical protein